MPNARTTLLRLTIACLLLAAAACEDDGDAPSPDTTPEPTASAEAEGSSWTMLAHGPESSFHNANEMTLTADNAASLKVAWTFDARGNVASTPAVADGRVYVVSTTGAYALDAQTGAEIWRNTDARGTSSPTLLDGKLYINGSSSVLFRLDASTGAEEWQAEIDPNPVGAGFSSPVIAGDLVIVGSSSIEEVSARENASFRGSLVAFDRETGDERWRHYTADPPYNGVSIWSSPSVDIERGLVFASTGNNYTEEAGPTSDAIFALELATGELVWNRQLSEGDVFTVPSPRSEDSDFGTNPILFDAEIDGEQRALVGAGQKSGMFWTLDRLTGEIVWSRQVGGGSALIGGMLNNGAYDGERIIVAGNDGESDAPGGEPANGSSTPLGAASIATSVLTALNPADGEVLWERQLPAWVWAPITIANGVGFVAAETDLQAFDTATGRRLTVIGTEGTIASGASIVDGRVYFGSGLAYFGTTNGTLVYALELP